MASYCPHPQCWLYNPCRLHGPFKSSSPSLHVAAEAKLSSDPTTNEAVALINSMRDQANAILSAALGQHPLVSFSATSAGNFPFYYKNPTNLLFNVNTYNWVNSNIAAGGVPTQLDSGNNFTNLNIEVLSKISYTLSSSDQQLLNAAQANAVNQQMALLTAWQTAYGSLPPPQIGMQPIDVILNTIATTWASPPTTLTAIQQSVNPRALLNTTPASGLPILPVLANYLNAMGATVPLLNSTTMNNAYLAKALAALQTPQASNGAMLLENNQYFPAYTMANQLPDIINNLSNTGSSVSLSMQVTRTSAQEFQVSVAGSTGFSIPIYDFFTLGVTASASYFSDSIATTSNSVSISMSFPGVTLVNYGPTQFNMSSSQGWYWMSPITQAIKNGTSSTVTGFKFSPQPGIDFSTNGNFGFLTGLAISNMPTIVITVVSSSYASIATTIKQSSSLKLSFLGIPLGSISESTYSSDVQTESSTSTVTIKLSPPDRKSVV